MWIMTPMLASAPLHPGIITLMFLVGVTLVLIETLLPGVILGLIGGAITAVSIYFAFTDYGLGFGFALTGVATVVIPLAVVWVLLKTTLRDKQTSDGGYVSAPADLATLTGMRGQALTALRPAGSALIGRTRVDVVSDGTFIEAGVPIIVSQVEGGRVVVRPEA
jgi:membrane-bound serine protease (ClpP class)